MKKSGYQPVHPGSVLKQMLVDSKITTVTAAAALGIARKNLSLILNGHTPITLEMAVRLSRALPQSAEFWLNMQMSWDLRNVDPGRFKVKSLLSGKRGNPGPRG